MYLDSPRLPPNVSVGVGERLEITCFIGGYPIPQVFWFKDGTQLNEHNPDNDFQVSLLFINQKSLHIMIFNNFILARHLT